MREQIRPRSPWIFAVLAGMIMVVPAVATAAGSGSTSVKKLRAYTLKKHARSVASLPAPAVEALDQVGGDPASVQEPLAAASRAATGPLRTFVFKGGRKDLCIVRSKEHAVVSCVDTLVYGAGKISASSGLVDGETFATGFVANGVHAITVTSRGTTVSAALANNTWVAPLPDATKSGIPAFTVRAVDAAGNTITAQGAGTPPPN